jgi:phosphoglycolate phosphatase-like HAD superfamily hydrolase
VKPGGAVGAVKPGGAVGAVTPSGVVKQGGADLTGIDLVVFDKDGTLIDFDVMWAGWTIGLAEALEAAAGMPLAEPLFAAFGFCADAGRADRGSPLGSHSMGELRALAVATVERAGRTPAEAERIVAETWRAPDPVGLAVPLADLRALFGALRTGGRRIAVATGDDRGPTVATLEVLGVASLVDAIACPDDGHPTKPDPGMFAHLCATLGVPTARTAMVGDSSVDLEMARAAGSGLVVGVLSGVGSREELAPLADVLLDSVADLVGT